MRTRLLSCLFVWALAWLHAPAVWAGDDLVGQFAGSLDTGRKTLEITLDCRQPGACEMSWDGHPTTFSQVSAYPKFEVATNALACVRRRDASRITDPEMMAEQSALAPMLASGASFERCWDMNNPTPTFTLACTVNRKPFDVSHLYLLVANPWGSGQCGYLIFALKRNG